MSPDFDNTLGENAIETRNLGRKFGKFEAVKNVNLTVPKGTVFGLLGVNGAGKSTIIKMVMGHLRPTTGEVRVLGRGLGEDLLGIRRRVAYVSENRYLYEWMTVEESIRFTRSFHETWDDKKAADLLKRFSLPAAKKVRQLSRGNRARRGLRRRDGRGRAAAGLHARRHQVFLQARPLRDERDAARGVGRARHR